MRIIWAVFVLACGVKSPPLPPERPPEVREETRSRTTTAPVLEVLFTAHGGETRLAISAPWPARFSVAKVTPQCSTPQSIKVAQTGERAGEARDRDEGPRTYTIVATSPTGEKLVRHVTLGAPETR